MAMSKKDYQELARALYEAHIDSNAYSTRGDEVLAHAAGVRAAVTRIARVMQQNPKFRPELFKEACETGKCKGMK